MSPDRLVVGLHPIGELLRAGRPVRRLHLARGRADADLAAAAGSAGVPVELVEPAALDALAPGLVHQGAVAVAPPFAYAELGDVLAAASGPPLLVALDGVTDPHNLGAVCRTAEAVGAHAVLLPGRRSASVTPTVEKAAAGALAHLPVVRVGNLVATLRQLADRPVWALGLDAQGDLDLADSPLRTEPLVLVVGAEGRGLARLTREACDQLVTLPMRGRVASLNASVAAGVALYEVLRARIAAGARPG